MDKETVKKLIEVLKYYAQMTYSPEWIIQFIDDIEKSLTPKE